MLVSSAFANGPFSASCRAVLWPKRHKTFDRSPPILAGCRNSIKTELAGKLLANKRAAIQPRTTMMQVEAVVKMLQPRFNIASIAAERRNKSSPWFGRRAAAR